MRRTFLIVLAVQFASLLSGLFGQCICTNCPQEMPDNFTGDFLINVSGAVNNDLGNPAQGVCGVYITFDHEYVGDLEIILTSPGGQSVTLLGPIGLFGETDGSLWNVLFVPCATPAAPDPNQSAIWSNDGFTTNETYTGSYYPNSGCLEDFNAGPVDGTWTLTVTDEQALDMGNFLNYNIVFCDDTGIECVSCDPGGGTLPDPGFAGACEGSPELNMNLPPNHSFNEDPDPNEYDYLYVISQNDVIQEYALTPDLSGYPVGVYEVCGLSYYIPDEPDIPAADGSLTVSVLQAQLESTTPPICGELSNNCLTIEVYPIPDPVDIEAVICPDETYSLGNEIFSASGNYTVNLQNADGCDSIVNLDLTVLDPAVYDLEATICEGSFFEVGNADFSQEGIFQIVLNGQAAYGCDSTITLSLTVLNPQVSIAEPDTLDCKGDPVLLDASGSTFGANPSFQWTHADGDGISGSDDVPVIEVTQPGTYILVITETGPGGVPFCTSTDSVEVYADVHLPQADAGSDLVYDCLTDSLSLDASGSFDSLGNPIDYSWTGPNGFTSTQLNPIVTDSGIYILSVENLVNGCVDTDTAVLILDNIIEEYTPSAGIIGCLDVTASLSVTSDPSDSLLFLWEGPQGFQSVSSDTLTEVPGDYTLFVTAQNGCMDTVTVSVIENSDIPDISGFADTITCSQPEVQIQTQSTFSQLAYLWSGPQGFVSALPSPFVSVPGVYELTVTAPNGCSNVLAVQVVSDTVSPSVVASAETLTCSDSVATVSAATNYQGVTYSWLLDTVTLTGPLISVTEPDTIQLTVTAPNGCIAEAEVVVESDRVLPEIVVPLPDTLTCATDTVVIDASASVPNGSLIFEWTNSIGGDLGGSSNLLVTTPGEYALAITDAANGCVTEDTFSVIQDTTHPQAIAFAQGILSCASDSAELDGSQSTGDGQLQWAWFDPSGVGLSNLPQTQTGRPGVHVLVVAGQNGCTDSAFVDVAIDTISPIAEASTQDTLTCSQPTGELSSSGSDAGPGFSILWTGPDGLPAGTGETITVSQPGLYVLTVANNQNGCLADDSVTLIASALPPVAIIAEADTLNCVVSQTVLDGTPSTGQGNIGWEWTSENGSPLGASSTLQVDAAGTYFLEVSDLENGCKDTTSVSVSIDTLSPTAQAGGGDTLTCERPEIVLGQVGSGSAESLDYQWTDDTGVGVGTSDTITVSIPGLYFLLVTNPDNGCTASDSVLISEDVEIPLADAGQDVILDCSVDSVVLFGQSASQGALEFTWIDGSGQPVSDSALAAVAIPGNYTLVVTFQRNGCTATDQVAVSPDSQSPIASVEVPDTLTCAQTMALLDGSASSSGPLISYEWLLDGQVVGLQNTLQTSEAGAYVFTVFNAQNSCETSQQVLLVRDTTKPIISAGPDDTLNCLKPELFITAEYQDPDFLLSWLYEGTIPTGPGVQQLITIPGVYTLIVTDPTNGCSASDDVEVFIDTASPVINIPPPAPLTCIDTTVVLDASGSDTGPQFMFSWTDIQSQVLGSGPQLFVQMPGSYTLTLANLDNGCTSIQSVTVSQDTFAPFPPVLDNQLLTCKDPIATLDASSTQGATSLAFDWLVDGQAVGSGSSLSVVEPGTYTLILTSLINECKTAVSVDVEQDTAAPVVNPGQDGLLTCQQTDWDLVGTATGANGAFDYSWFGPGGNVLSQTQALTVANPGVYTFAVTDTINGCNSSGQVEIQENIVSPEALASGSGPLTCSNPSVTLSAAGSSNGPLVSLFWIGPQGTVVSDMADFDTDIPGDYQLILTFTDNGCADTALLEVIQDTLYPVINLTPTNPYILTCTTPQLTFDAASSAPAGQLGFTWTDEAGNGLSTLPTLTVEVEGTYNLEIVNTANGCVTSTAVGVSADQEVPTVILDDPDTLTCLNDTIVLSASGSSTGAEFAYGWSGPGWSPGQTGNTLAVFAPGLYSLQITDTSNGCTASASTTVEERKELPDAVATVSGELDCVTPRVLLSGSGSSQGPQFSAQWETGTGGIEGNPQSLEVEATVAGLYVLLISDLENGCTATAEVTVTVIEDQPQGADVVVTQPSCFGKRDGQIAIESVYGGTPPILVFFRNQGPYAQAKFPNLAAGNYELVIEDARGCLWDTLLTVPTPPLLTVDLGDDQLIDLGSDVLILAQPSRQIDSVQWLLPENFECPGFLACQDTPTVTTLYRIRVVDEKGCVAEDEMRVRVRKPRQVLIPNVFSPNDDGFNDYLGISVGNDVAKVRSFGIYSRWGEQIFERTNYLPSGDPRIDGWDGRFRGRQLDPDVFVGIAEVEFKDGSIEVFEGSVTLIR